MTSLRNAPPLFGSGLIDALPDTVIVAGAVPRDHGVYGRAHLVRDLQGRERVGRFGWKADTATLRQFVADAFRNELGITNPWAPTDYIPVGRDLSQRCAGEADTPEVDGTTIVAVTAYLASLPAPAPQSPCNPVCRCLWRSVVRPAIRLRCLWATVRCHSTPISCYMTLAQISMTKSSKATPLGEIGGLPRSGASAPDRACSTTAARARLRRPSWPMGGRPRARSATL